MRFKPNRDVSQPDSATSLKFRSQLRNLASEKCSPRQADGRVAPQGGGFRPRPGMASSKDGRSNVPFYSPGGSSPPSQFGVASLAAPRPQSAMNLETAPLLHRARPTQWQGWAPSNSEAPSFGSLPRFGVTGQGFGVGATTSQTARGSCFGPGLGRASRSRFPEVTSETGRNMTPSYLAWVEEPPHPVRFSNAATNPALVRPAARRASFTQPPRPASKQTAAPVGRRPDNKPSLHIQTLQLNSKEEDNGSPTVNSPTQMSRCVTVEKELADLASR